MATLAPVDPPVAKQRIHQPDRGTARQIRGKEGFHPFDLLPEDAWTFVFAHIEVTVMVRSCCRTFNALARCKYSREPNVAMMTQIRAVTPTMQLVQWALHHHCPSEGLINAVAEHGNCATMEYLLTACSIEHYFRYVSDMTLFLAAKSGCLAMVKLVQSFIEKPSSNMWIDVIYGSPHLLPEFGAAMGGHMDLMQVLAQDKEYWPTRKTLEYAARGPAGLEMLQWMWADWQRRNWLLRKPVSAAFCEAAAAAGKLDALKCAHERLLIDDWDIGTYTGAAAAGRLDIIRWAFANGCLLSKIADSDRDPSDNPVTAAARAGSIEILEWFSENAQLLFVDWSLPAMRFAAYSGHIHVMEWLWGKSTPDMTNIYVAIIEAARFGQFDAVKWLYHRCSVRKETYNNLRKAPFSCKETYNNFRHAFECAARSGNLALMQWMYLHDFPYCSYTMCAAVMAGDTRNTEWLKKIGCKLDPCVWSTRLGARQHSMAFSMVKWLYENLKLHPDMPRFFRPDIAKWVSQRQNENVAENTPARLSAV